MSLRVRRPNTEPQSEILGRDADTGTCVCWRSSLIALGSMDVRPASYHCFDIDEISYIFRRIPVRFTGTGIAHAISAEPPKSLFGSAPTFGR